MKSGAVITALALSVLMGTTAGCGGGGGGSSASSSSGTGTSTSGGGTTTPPVVTPPVTPPSTSQTVSAPALGSFTASLTEDPYSITAGGTVNFTLKITNSSSTAATIVAEKLAGVNVPIASLRVTNSAGQVVYPVGATPQDTPPAPPSGGVTLQPGQSLQETKSVAVFAKADTYPAVATFTVAASTVAKAQTVTLGPLPVTAK